MFSFQSLLYFFLPSAKLFWMLVEENWVGRSDTINFRQINKKYKSARKFEANNVLLTKTIFGIVIGH